MRIGIWFIAALWAFGLASGLVVASRPGLRDLALPSLAWPLILALVADLALMPLARAGRIEPVTMNERAIAVIGAALIHTLALAAMPGA